MIDKKEKNEKTKPVRFAIPLDASDAELQAFIDKLKQYSAEEKGKITKQISNIKEK